MTAGPAFILVMPDGTDDGFLWGRDGRDLAAAQRIFAHPQRWTTLERQGWRVEEVSAEDMKRRSLARADLHARTGR